MFDIKFIFDGEFPLIDPQVEHESTVRKLNKNTLRRSLRKKDLFKLKMVKFKDCGDLSSENGRGSIILKGGMLSGFFEWRKHEKG